MRCAALPGADFSLQPWLWDLVQWLQVAALNQWESPASDDGFYVSR